MADSIGRTVDGMRLRVHSIRRFVLLRFASERAAARAAEDLARLDVDVSRDGSAVYVAGSESLLSEIAHNYAAR